MRRLGTTLPPLLSAVLLCCALAACDDDVRPAVNRAPTVTITGGAAEAQEVHYRVEFFWLGTDPDGPIDHYEYAVDDTTEWTVTENTSQAFLFSADSLATKTSDAAIVTSDFHRWHSFRVRAVDGLGARSAVERRTFNAFTIAPVTRITHPDPKYRQLGDSPRFKWTARDDDCGRPDKRPIGYRYKLVGCWDEFSLIASLGILRADGSIDPEHAAVNRALPDSVLDDPAVSDSVKKEWIEVPADVESIRFHNLPLGSWGFAVRAIDEAGAIEPEYILNSAAQPGNVYFFETLDTGGLLSFTLCSSALGCFSFPRDGNLWDTPFPADREACFTLSATAEWYGAEIAEFRWGLDDPSRPNHVSAGNARICVSFPESEGGATHHLYVSVRDTDGRETIGTVRLNVIAFTFDKKVLIIDDFANLNPSDGQHDALLDRVLQGRFAHADSSEIRWINGPGETPGPEPPDPPTLTELSRYELVVIYHLESVNNQLPYSVLGNLTSADNPANAAHNPKRRALATYVAAGGKLWVWGVEVTGGLHGDNYIYPKEPENPAGQETPGDLALFDANSFLYNFLQFRRGVIRAVRPSSDRNALISAAASAEGAARGYPPVLEIDRSHFPDPNRGLAAESIHGAPLIVAGLDTLYTYVAKSPESEYNGRPTALYYRSPLGAQGDIAYFGFYYYFLQEEQVRAMCDQVFEDLFEQPAPAGRRLP